MLDVTLLPILEDNYCYIIQSAGKTAIIDPGEADPILKYLKENNLTPDYIIITHRHWDHIDGIEGIKEKFYIPVIGPEKEKDKIPLISQTLKEGDVFEFGDDQFEIIETPGHTIGHICYYSPQSKILFSADTLFAMGCGRLFEGTAENMFQSFEKLRTLPDETKVYCGHEYTMANANFCLSVDSENQELITHAEEMQKLRENNQPTIPTTIGMEKETNIFMRAKDASEFKKYRDLKDQF